MKIKWQNFNSVIYRNKFPVPGIAALLAIHMLNFPFAGYPILADRGPTWLGLDPSWQMGLNYALLKGLNWGNDIIYTYGPLGFLVTRVGWGISRWIFLFFDLFIVINFFLIFKDLITKSSNKVLAILIIICLSLLERPGIGGGLPWVMLVMTFYWMYKSFRNPRLLHFIMISLLITLSFYCKLNTGIVIILFFIIHLANLLFFKKIDWLKAAIALLITTGLILIMAFVLHVSLIPYIKGSLEIAKGYNDIMYLEEDHLRMEIIIKVLFRCIIIFYLLYAFYLFREKKYSELIFIILFVGYSFLLKKQSVVRNDMGHLQAFLCYAPLPLLMLNIIPLRRNIQLAFLGSSLAILVICLLFNAERIPIDIAFQDRYAHKKDYLLQFSTYNSRPYLYQKDKREIPQRVLQKIGNSTVDIFPWDSEYLMENHLNYTPRPVTGSGTLTSYLHELNYKFYVNKPPEFVIYDYDAIDERYPFNDEFPANLFLVKNYSVVDSFTSNERWRILLQKKRQTSAVSFKKTKEETMPFQAEIPVNDISFLKMDVNYNLKGKLKSFRYKPSRVNVMFQAENGEWFSFKTSPEMLKAGVLVEKLILSNKDFANFILNKDSLLSINKVKLQADPQYFSADMKIEYFKND